MASLAAFQAGIEYRNLILSEKQSDNSVYLKYTILDTKQASRSKLTTKELIAKRKEEAEHTEYVKQQRLFRIAHMRYVSLPTLPEFAFTLRRDRTTILAPLKCSCAKYSRVLFADIVDHPKTSVADFMELAQIADLDEQEESKVLLIYYGSLYYCRYLTTITPHNPYKSEKQADHGSEVKYWGYIAPFLLGIIKYILCHPSDYIEIQPEMSRRLGTKNKIVLDQLCMNLWILRIYDILYGLRQSVPQASQQLPYYLSKAVANDVVFGHSCNPTVFSMNIDYLQLASYYKYVDPDIAHSMIEVYTTNNMTANELMRMPQTNAESYVSYRRT
jgi:hypothetical protein